MAWICDCGLKMSCLETRHRENYQYRRYSCSCGKKLSTTEQEAEDFETHYILNPVNFERVRDSLVKKLTETIDHLQKVGKPRANPD